MRDVITYYYPDGRVEVDEKQAARRGVVWVDGEYKPPTYPSALNLRVGEAGIRVVAVVRDFQASGGDASAVVQAWSPYLTESDVRAAIDFYRSNEAERNEIDHKLAEDAAIV